MNVINSFLHHTSCMVNVVMDESNGRIYYPTPEKAGGVTVGLAYKICIGSADASQYYVYPKLESAAEGSPISKPTHIIWNGTCIRTELQADI